MKVERKELIVIGAGPAGLSAAIEAASHGVKATVFDENARPGGQLFKQIHKFFGSKEHKAKIRGFRIGEDLLKEAEEKITTRAMRSSWRQALPKIWLTSAAGRFRASSEPARRRP